MTVPESVDFTTKRHSKRPYLRLLVKDSDGNAYDFTGAVGVTFLMYDSSGTEKVNAAGVIETPLTTGVLKYEWASGDLDTAGEFKAEFDVDYGGGSHMTLPMNGIILVRVYEDLDDA